MARILLGGAALGALATFGVQALLYKRIELDDPYITFRYALHLARGQGLLWNLGEDPVEGCTELLWVLVSALGIKLGMHPLFFAKWVGAGLGGFTVAVLLTRLNYLGGGVLGRTVAAMALALAPLHSFYAVSAMGHPLFVLLITLAGLSYGQGLVHGRADFRAAASALFAVSTYARPEGLGLFGVTLAFELGLLALERRDARRRLVALVVPFALLWTPYFLWRLSYFGYPFPNTYYAKHTGGGGRDLVNGVRYLSSAVQVYLGIPLAFSFAAFLSASTSTDAGLKELLRKHAATLYAFLLVLAIGGYVVVMGGDDTSAFPSTRLILPALPLAMGLLGGAVQLLGQRGPRGLAAGIAALTLSGLGFAMSSDGLMLLNRSTPGIDRTSTISTVLRDLFRLDTAAYGAPEVATWINQHLKRPCTIALPWAGKISYFVDCAVIDTLGLNDEHIAHLPKRQSGPDVKGDPAYVLGRKPDLVFVNVHRGYVLGQMTFEQAGGWKVIDREMLDLVMKSPEYRLLDTRLMDVAIFERVR